MEMFTKKHKFIACGMVLLFLLLLSGCNTEPAQDPAATQNDSLNITVSILPEAYFVERIGGNHVRVNVMVEPGADPHVYEPKPEQMKKLSESGVYFKIGVEFESAWMDKFASVNPSMVIVDVSEGIQRIPMEHHEHDHAGEEAGHEDEDEHEDGLDPHIWLSPEFVKVIANNIYTTLVEMDPEHSADYKSNLDAFLTDIHSLQERIMTSFTGNEIRNFLVFHPAWGYFAAEFNLVQIPVEVGGNEPSPRELAEVIDLAKENGIKVVFVSPQFSSKAAETIATELDGEIVPIDPLAKDWLDNLEMVAEAFNRMMKQ